MKARLRKEGIPLLFLLAAAVCFFWKATLAGKVLLPVDNLYQFLPWSAYAPPGFTTPHNPLISDSILQNYGWKDLLVQSLRQRQLPLWNPYELSGAPFFAPGQASVLYPFTILFLIIPLAHAYGYFAALHLFIAGAGAYVFLRASGVSRAGAVIGGLAFMFSARLITSILWPQMIGAMVYLPLLLLAIELIIRRSKGSWPILPTLGGALLLGISILAGHIEVSVYVMATMGLYALGRLISEWQEGHPWSYYAKAGGLCLALVVAGLGLAAVQLLPFYEVGSLNFRSGSVTYADVVGFALKLPQIFTFLMPDFYGNPTMANTVYWGPKDYVEQAAYIGVLPLALAALSLRRGGRQVWALWSVVVISLLLAFGTPLYQVIFFLLPGFNQIHSPFRWLIPYTAVMACLAGFGFDLVRERLARYRWLFAAAAAAAIAGFIIWQRFVVPHAPFPDRQLEIRNYLVMAGLLALSALAMWAGPKALGPLFIGLVAVDLGYFGIGFNTATSAAPLHSIPASVAFLQQDHSLFRVTSYGNDKTFEPNGNLMYGIQDIRGYDSVILSRYVQFLDLIEPQTNLQFNRVSGIQQPENLDSPLLNLLNVKYVLSAQPIADPRFKQVFDGDGLRIYQNLQAMQRATVVPAIQVAQTGGEQLLDLRSPNFDPARTAVVDGPVPGFVGGGAGGPAQVVSYSGRKVRVNATGPGMLVLADNKVPGWKATVDGQPAALYTADYAFRGVALGPGQHVVDFVYLPESLRLGALISGLTLAAMAMALAFMLWFRRARLDLTRPMHTAGRVTKNSLSPMVSNVASKLMSFGFGIFYIPHLGLVQVGKYTVAATVILFMDTVIGFGLQQLVARDVAREKSASNRYITNAIAVRLGATVLVGVPVIILALAMRRFFGFDSDTTAVLIILIAGFVPDAFSNVFSHVFDGHELMEYKSAIQVLTGLVNVILGVIFILAGWNILGLALAALLTNLVKAAIFYLLISRTVVRPSFDWDFALIRRITVGAYPIMLNQLLTVFFFNIDVPLLRALRDNREVGVYGVAYKFVSAVLIVPAAFVPAVFPILSRQAASEREALKRGYDMSLKVLLLIAFPLVAGFEVLAGEIIRGLYGKQFQESILALRILMLFLPFSYVNGLTQYVLIALDKQRSMIRFFAVTALFNVVVNILLIPRFGYIAASAVTVGSEVVLLAPLYLLTARQLGQSSILTIAVRPALASLGAALVMLAMKPPLSPLGPIGTLLLDGLLGFVTYAAALLLLRTFTTEEVGLVRSLFRQRNRRVEAPASA